MKMSARLALSTSRSTRRASASSIILEISGVTSHISNDGLFGATTSKFGERFFLFLFWSVQFLHFYQHHLVVYCTSLSVIFINSRVSPMYSRPILCLLSSTLEELFGRLFEIYSSEDAIDLRAMKIGFDAAAVSLLENNCINSSVILLIL